MGKGFGKAAGEHQLGVLAQQGGGLQRAQAFALLGQPLDVLARVARKAPGDVVHRLGEGCAVVAVVEQHGIELRAHQHQALDAFVRQLRREQALVAFIEKLAGAGEDEHHIAPGEILARAVGAAQHRVVQARGVHDLDVHERGKRQLQLGVLDDGGKAPLGGDVVLDASGQIGDVAAGQFRFTAFEPALNFLRGEAAARALHQLARGGGEGVVRRALGGL